MPSFFPHTVYIHCVQISLITFDKTYLYKSHKIHRIKKLSISHLITYIQSTDVLLQQGHLGAYADRQQDRQPIMALYCNDFALCRREQLALPWSTAINTD